MTKFSKKPPETAVSRSPEAFWSNFLFLPIDQIGTGWSSLRDCGSRVHNTALRDLPIRVVLHDGRYEVIDGFKRLERWKQAGAATVPVLVEECTDSLSPKQLLLKSNSPQRTISPLDEARVVNSLIKDDGLTVHAVANLLGRRREWVVRRRSLTRLSVNAQLLLGNGRISLMVAQLLISLKPEDQDSILTAIDKHSLKMRESQLLIQTWRVASDSEKQSLLADPFLQRESEPAPSQSTRLKALEVKLSALRQALDEFSSMVIPGDLVEAEQRRLNAICASIQIQITQMAQSYKTKELVEPEAAAVQTMPADILHEIEDEEFYGSMPDPLVMPDITGVFQCHLPSSFYMECAS